MIFFLKDLGLIAISLFTAILAGLGISPNAAVAPDLQPPTPLVVVQEKEEEPEETTPTQEEDEDSEPEETPAVAEKPKTDPFKDLADALAQLADETPVTEDIPEEEADVNVLVRDALVNLICTTETAGPFNSISASGVVIDPRGVILTNAHVAQYFLLENYPRPGFVECIVRIGSPATAAYTAELLFLPSSWIEDNAQKIDDENPTGNGEHDYALVRITGTVNNSITLPKQFDYLPVALYSPYTGDTVLVAGYPAGFLGGITVAKELYAASAQAKIGQVYTYGSQTIDIFSIGGSVVAQQGSSGGAAATEEGILTGLIVTSTDAPDTASRDLRALTTEYIIRDFKKESGLTLSSYLNTNLAERALAFRLGTAPTLTQLLVNILEN